MTSLRDASDAFLVSETRITTLGQAGEAKGDYCLVVLKDYFIIEIRLRIASVVGELRQRDTWTMDEPKSANVQAALYIAL